ncbi:MAG: tRNA (guanosine(46)-N7)-methyltransferase TrmB [Clostridia bacterium]|nr:tRNA (guanosine(46)-N7)-methyltransferase TrmB [Clostridia bacterium]
MRMRRKKNLESRLEECSDILFEIRSDDKNFSTAIENKSYFNFSEIFGNSNPVHMEIGCGKGQFVCEIAKRNPDINYIAVEKSANVIVQACEKAIEAGLKNVYFIKGGAEYLPCFIPDGTIERLYLNFSCPFPKKKYENHRLTNKAFLKLYEMMLAPAAEIHQKTDNMHFFEYSIGELSDYGFTIKNVSLDLHNSDFEGNIVTEYEKRFSDLGQPIYRLEAYLK